VNRIPQAGGIDLQIGGDLSHAGFRLSRCVVVVAW
jgi:hypothetical protein